MVIRPRIRGFVCVTSHPEGCDAHVREQIDCVLRQGRLTNGPKNVLIVGASTGYGLASRIASTFGSGAKTLGVFFERPAEVDRPATPGWYNSIAVTNAARKAGLYAANLNGDAFTDDLKTQAVEIIKRDMGPIDLVVYSLAAPRRIHPRTGIVHKSVLKPVSAEYRSKTVDTDTGVVSDVAIPPASEQEIQDTIAVMGGEDWELWMQALEQNGLIAPGATSVAYSYIGPEVTWPVYKNGTIGLAKNDLELAAKRIDALLKTNGYGRAFVSVNKALVTQASSAIPVVPLYIAVLYKIMKSKGLHEGCIEQIQRLFRTQMYNGSALQFDDAGRVRIDDWEMRSDVQAEIPQIWQKVTTENLEQLTDIAGYRSEFLKLFGFGLAGVDYAADVDPNIPLP